MKKNGAKTVTRPYATRRLGQKKKKKDLDVNYPPRREKEKDGERKRQRDKRDDDNESVGGGVKSTLACHRPIRRPFVSPSRGTS